MTPRRRLGWLTLVVGLVLLLIVGRRAIGQPPLYDGVVVEDPYRFLDPASGGPGSPSSATGTLPLDGGVSPAILVATQENPPQAELIIDRGAIALAPGTTSITATIEPVQPPAAAPAPGTTLAGNVYRFSLADQAGTDLALKPGQTATVVVRAPNGITTGTIVRYVDGQWQPQATVSGGLPDLYSTNATELGAFAVTVNATQASASPGASPGSSLAGSPSPTRPPATAPAEGPSAPIWIAIGLLAVALLLGIWYLRDVARGPAPPTRR